MRKMRSFGFFWAHFCTLLAHICPLNWDSVLGGTEIFGRETEFSGNGPVSPVGSYLAGLTPVVTAI
jgi:hypothetical protein